MIEVTKGLIYDGDWQEIAEVCGAADAEIWATIEQARDIANDPGPVRMLVSLCGQVVVTTLYNELTKIVLAQAETVLPDGCCPPTTIILAREHPTTPPTQTL